MTKTVVVAGASGLAGSAIAQHFAALDGWRVITVSRRPPADLPDHVEHVPLDLSDRAAALAALERFRDVDHVAYAALLERDDLLQGWQESEHVDVNLGMLRNLLDGIHASGSELRHVVTLQGGKAYGSHLHPVPVPAKERWPRAGHKIFYWEQEDLLRERQASEGWGLTILRPSMILGGSIGSPMSMVAAIGVYAAVMRETAGVLPFPGAGRFLAGATDSRLIAQATEFSFERTGQPEIFNVVNGDVFAWQDLWPSIAARFDIPVAPPTPMSLAAEMPRRAEAWDAIVVRHKLRPLSMEQLVSSAWQFADFAIAQDTILMSPIKLRQAGFAACYDTEDSFAYWLDRMQASNLLPR